MEDGRGVAVGHIVGCVLSRRFLNGFELTARRRWRGALFGIDREPVLSVRRFWPWRGDAFPGMGGRVAGGRRGLPGVAGRPCGAAFSPRRARWGAPPRLRSLSFLL